MFPRVCHLDVVETVTLQHAERKELGYFGRVAAVCSCYHSDMAYPRSVHPENAIENISIL